MSTLTYDANKTVDPDPLDTYTPGNDGEKKKFEALPIDTVLNVEVVRCEIRDVNQAITPWKKYAKEVSFAFKVIDDKVPNSKGRWFWADTEAKLDNSDRCRLRQWIQEIIGVPSLPEVWTFDPNDLIGLTCRIRLGTYFSKKKQEICNSVEDIRSVSSAPTDNTALVFNGNE